MREKLGEKGNWAYQANEAIKNILASREQTVEKLKQYLAGFDQNGAFLDQQHSAKDLKELSSAVEVLVKEAAALHVLARAVRLVKANWRPRRHPGNEY